MTLAKRLKVTTELVGWTLYPCFSMKNTYLIPIEVKYLEIVYFFVYLNLVHLDDSFSIDLQCHKPFASVQIHHEQAISEVIAACIVQVIVAIP